MAQCKRPVVYIVGPTASGKTALSVQLARQFHGEIVCGDSMQIYKNMPIATAAPTAQEQANIPHHLFAFLKPDEAFSVSQYVQTAKQTVLQIQKDGALPFVVGGTGLYISSLADNIDFGEEQRDMALREELVLRAQREGNAYMYAQLLEIDPESAQKISPNDLKRIIRAIEVYRLSGERMSDRVKHSKAQGQLFDNCFIGVNFKSREALYTRINQRVDNMLAAGLLQEAEQAWRQRGATAAQAIGHKELFAYFNGEIALETAVDNLKTQTRRYAKRQITWFSHMSAVQWIYMDEGDNPCRQAAQQIELFLNKNREVDV